MEVVTMTKKRNVEDSELEHVSGGGGVLDPPDTQKLQETNSSGSASELATTNHDLGNDMILTETDRG
jgi:hypothetical protein